jgi:hypothetical protein
MFCSNCGNQVQAQGKFCDKCGTAVSGKAVKATKASPAVVTPDEPETVDYAAPAPAKSKKNLYIIGGAVVAVVAVVAAFTLIKSGPTVNEDNAQDYVITASNVAFDATEGDGFDMSGQVLSECSVESQITPMFETGSTWATGSIKSTSGSSSTFHIDQRIFTAPEADLEKLTSLLTTVGTDSSCDASSEGGYASYDFSYENPRSIKDTFGIDAKGVTVDVNVNVCISGCSKSQGMMVIAYKGNTAMLYEFRGSNDEAVGPNELKAEVAKALEGLN